MPEKKTQLITRNSIMIFRLDDTATVGAVEDVGLNSAANHPLNPLAKASVDNV